MSHTLAELQVYLSYRTPPKTNLEGDIELKGLISSIDGCRIQFEDNTCIDVDSIIHCTGKIVDFTILTHLKLNAQTLSLICFL